MEDLIVKSIAKFSDVDSDWLRPIIITLWEKFQKYLSRVQIKFPDEYDDEWGYSAYNGDHEEADPWHPSKDQWIHPLHFGFPEHLINLFVQHPMMAEFLDCKDRYEYGTHHGYHMATWDGDNGVADTKSLANEAQFHFPFLHFENYIIGIHCLKQNRFSFFRYFDSPGNMPVFADGLLETLLEGLGENDDDDKIRQFIHKLKEETGKI